MRAISPTARRLLDSTAIPNDEVVLLRIRHPDLDEDILVSSDATEMVSVSPLQFGTRSTWLGEEKVFLTISMGIDLPDDTTDAPMAASLVLDILDSRIAEVLTSTHEPATVDMAVVLRSSPDFIERQFLGLLMEGAEGDGGSVSLSFERRKIHEDPCPRDRTTKERFPGLHF
ncbi:hypothetical protein [Shinella sp. BYT-45]|uniref:hypothetical protein n=1 Tax=Shinella sp. BYT-45 TaxID=3377377 RepID=UPI00397FCA43